MPLSPHTERCSTAPQHAPQYAKAVLIYNPQAGRQRWLRPQQIQAATEELERNGIVVQTQATTVPGSGTKMARDAIQDGADLIVVCGGDGTINELICGMAHSRVPLAVLPCGTANVLARELELPLDVRTAARAILSATPRRLAMGLAGTRYFLLMAGVGFDAQIIYNLALRWKNLLGIGSYVLETIRQVLFEPKTAFIVSTEEKRLEATYACISKSRHYGPFRMVREADLFSESFFVYCFRSRNRLRYFLYSLALLTGRLDRLPDVIRFPASKVRFEQTDPASKKVLFQVDGELAGRLPCTIEMVPDALTLLVPAAR
ncbi:MAG: diacylglycerol kinase family protein [Acidobacteriota bacterium]